MVGHCFQNKKYRGWVAFSNYKFEPDGCWIFPGLFYDLIATG